VFCVSRKLLSQLCIANYLLVLLVGELLHTHGHQAESECDGPTCCESKLAAVLQPGSAPDASTRTVKSRGSVAPASNCLVCRFWGQKTLAPQTESSQLSTPFAPFALPATIRAYSVTETQPVIRGPPATA
jgi:hypothetical protein